MTFHAPTLWSSNGPRWCWNQPDVRLLLDQARPPGLQIHTTPDGLTYNAPSLTRDIHGAFDEIDVWWSITGDVGAPKPKWEDPARAAVDNGVTTFVIDCETAWLGASEDDARRAVDSIVNVAPSLEIVLTTFGQLGRFPNPFPPPTTTGRGGNFPIGGFAGMRSRAIKKSLWQVYFDDADVTDTWGRGLRALTRSQTAASVQIAQNSMRPGVEFNAYLQLHGLRTDNLCAVAATVNVAAWWCLQPSYLQKGGTDALRAMCELARRGFIGPDQIIDFQASVPGLVVDNRVGPRTLEALGIT